MVAAVPELKAAGNPKQNFDMLVIRMINISELPPISQLLETKPETRNQKPEADPGARDRNLSTPAELSSALSADKELTLLSEWNKSEAIDFSDGKIKMHRLDGGAFAANLAAYLAKKTGKRWEIELADSENKPSVSESVAAEIRGNPLVADALNLFSDAMVMSVK
jgi:hypothetical protein